MICKNCGAKTLDGNLKCMVCGAETQTNTSLINAHQKISENKNIVNKKIVSVASKSAEFFMTTILYYVGVSFIILFAINLLKRFGIDLSFLKPFYIVAVPIIVYKLVINLIIKKSKTSISLDTTPNLIKNLKTCWIIINFVVILFIFFESPIIGILTLGTSIYAFIDIEKEIKKKLI